MLSRILSFIILVPLAVLLIILCVANRGPVTLSMDPIGSLPQLSVSAPLFILLFGAVILGVILGGIGTWFTQSRYRQKARRRKREAEHWRREAEETKQHLRELRDARSNAALPPASSTALVAPRAA